MSNAAAKATLLKKLEDLHQIPTIPAVLAPLLRYLQQPMEQLDVHRVTDLIAQDKALTAQCLQMANSPLFGRWQKVESVRGAIMGLGFQRVSDIAMSCTVLNMVPRDAGIDPTAFWEHALGCALVCRHLARKIIFQDPGKAYLAGLLHDIGIIVNLWLLPKEFRAAFDFAKAEGIPLYEAEQNILGFSHCESGKLLAERWELAPDLTEAVAFHHSPAESLNHADLVAIVELSDLLCRMSGLNHGYIEKREVNLVGGASFATLSAHYEALREFDWARLTFELDSYMDEVHSLVRAIYRS
ncbi:MAG TPA: HDOD domain-containing protein [Candidatus Sulfotelmatobacter sp.]|nr:HDOD domain-containing protein [Candidatus Sulfotelmatobacter sp.]